MSGTDALAALLPAARIVGVMSRDVAAPPEEAWARVRHGTLGGGPLAGARLRELARDLGEPAMPGDALVPDAAVAATHEARLAAPPEAVRPWVTRIGADRAGLSGDTAPENLAGHGIHDAERIHPEWHARPGDRRMPRGVARRAAGAGGRRP